MAGDPALLAAPHEEAWRTRAGAERLIEWRCFVTGVSDGERFIVGVGHDVTERHEAAARQFLQFSVTRLLADARSLDEAAPALLEAVCQLTRWDVGEFWTADPEAGLVRLAARWSPSFDATPLEAAPTSLPRGAGLVGRVWVTGKPVWTADVQSDPGFRRAAAARAAGLRTALAFPVTTPAGVLAVVLVLRRASREVDPQLLAAAADIGEQVGQFIERTRADAALRASEARLRLALEAADMGWWEWDVRTGRTSWSPELDRLFGLPPGGFQGTHEAFLAMVHPEDRGRVFEAFDRIVAGQERYEAEFRVIRADGTTRWAAVRALVIRDDQGQPIRMIGVDRDTTAAKRDEDERARLAQLGRDLNESLDFDVLLPKIAATARELCGSDAARVGFRGSAVYGAEAAGTRRHDDCLLDPGIGLTGHVLDTGRPIRTSDYSRDPRFAATAAGRREAVVAALAVPIPGLDRVEGVLAVFNRAARPFTDRDEARLQRLADYAAVACRNAEMYRRAEAARAEAEAARAEAEAASRTKDRFLATLSHELRNPLASIGSAVEALNRLGDPDPGAARLRGIIARQTRHLGRLLEDLLDVTRVAFGKLALERRPLDLGEVVGRCVEALEAAGRLAGHPVDVRLPPEPVPVEGDRVRLEQVLGNLLDNAVKYSPAGAPIGVVAARAGGMAVLRVRDRGRGLAPEMLERIFEPFAQLEGPPSGGLGLGLAVVRGLVQQHGGTVEARSAGPGQGSEFEVRLPLASGVVGDPPRAAAPPRTRTRRVVVVEDSADMREALATLLEVLGHEVEVAADGEHGAALITGTRPDVALVDLALPGVDGCEVARRVRAAVGSAVRLVAVTGYGGAGDRERARAAGFDYHMVKPLDPEELAWILG